MASNKKNANVAKKKTVTSKVSTKTKATRRKAGKPKSIIETALKNVLKEESKKITPKPKGDYDKNLKVLFIDIETSPVIALVWGLFNQNIATNQIIHNSEILCFAAKWLDDDEVVFNSTQKTTFENMMKQIHDLLDQADVVVHYNGKKFDVPRINREFVKLRLPPPDRYAQIDLLQIVRAVGGFDSNRLEWVAKQLNISQKIDNAGMSLWLGCMKNDAESWQDMKEYNIQDTAMLEELYFDYRPWIRTHPNIGVYKSAAGEYLESPTCTNCGSTNLIKKGMAKTKTQMYQRYRCKDCGTPLRGRKTVIPKENRDNILVQEV